MHDGAAAGWLLAGALIASIAGMGWLALAMPAHAQQVWGRTASPAAMRTLRLLGALALCAALILCLAADHASMAVLVWAMSLAGAAVLVAMTLAWRAPVLGLLAPWVRRAAARR